jgi:hypothetical protein
VLNSPQGHEFGFARELFGSAKKYFDTGQSNGPDDFPEKSILLAVSLD